VRRAASAGQGRAQGKVNAQNIARVSLPSLLLLRWNAKKDLFWAFFTELHAASFTPFNAS
jgi:hypothetical protein